MTVPAHAPGAFFLRRAPTVSGKGCRVLLFDSGISAPDAFDGKLRRIGLAASMPTHRDSHALRVASLCADREMGLAPDAELLCALKEEAFSNDLSELVRNASRDVGRIHVIGHGWSAEGNPDLLRHHARVWQRFDEPGPFASLVIAPSGHDGEGRVRFPANLRSALSVGVCDEHGMPTAYCGRQAAVRKPELLVPAGPYLARCESGAAGSMGGASAAVGIAAGIAALWVERLLALGIDPCPLVLRAALLCTSLPARVPEHRILSASDALFENLPLAIQSASIFDAQPLSLTAVSDGGRLRICVVAASEHGGALWITPQPSFSVAIYRDGACIDSVDGEDWCRLEREIEPGPFEIRIRTDQKRARIAVVALAPGISALPARTPGHSKPRTILGVSASHDAAACLMQNGRIANAIQLERVTRTKHDGSGFLDDTSAADYCLHASMYSRSDVDVFAFNAQPLMPEYTGLSQPVRMPAFNCFDPFDPRCLFVSHHLAHAAAAFYGSPFEEAVVVVADGSGGSTSGADDLAIDGPALRDYLMAPLQKRPEHHVFSVYVFTRSHYELLHREYARSFNTRCGSSSIGETYAAVSQMLFRDWKEGSGKLMGLAPYGDAARVSDTLLRRGSDGMLHFDHAWKLDYAPPENGDAFAFRDLAARVQADLETALLERTTLAVERSGCRNLVFTGGIALNCVLNNRLRTESGAQAMFVLPASNDAGTAIGAAAIAEMRMTGTLPVTHRWHDSLGYRYREIDHDHAISIFADFLAVSSADSDAVAARIASGEVIGLFMGGAEFGPRALGNRSILADPRERRTWQHINANIKFREDFRPFAPVVIESRAHEFFELDEPSPYMLRVVKVRPEYRHLLQAVTHVDGTARVQTLRKEDNPHLYMLLESFDALTGFPILLNTSLNRRGEPIIETPRQAVEMLLSVPLDAMILGQRLLEPHRISPSARTRLRLAPGVRLECTVASDSGTQQTLAAPWQGVRYALDDATFAILKHADGSRTLAESTREAGLDPALSDGFPLLYALVSQRLVLCAADADAASGSAPSSAPIHRESSTTPELTASDDAEPARSGVDHGRVRPAKTTIADAMRIRSRIGVTRISDVTDFDYLGIPVALATRPIVSARQISATQGKGLTHLDARVSALMEAVERHAANHADGLRIATRRELAAEGATHYGAEVFGGHRQVSDDASIVWTEVRDMLSDEAAWVPAAAVFFPFVPSATTAPNPMRPMTTGLSAGKTFKEAILHGLYEVVERAAVSRHHFDGDGVMIDPSTIDGEEMRLVERFRSAGVPIAILRLENAILPTYVVNTLADDGPLANLVISGQGTACCARIALRRALLEAAQSRVVAIMGSREDLIRHSTHWAQSRDEAARLWNAINARATTRGTRSFAATSPHAHDPDALIDIVVARLRDRGLHHVLVRNLTRPAVGIPVVRVLVPGLIDHVSQRST